VTRSTNQAVQIAPAPKPSEAAQFHNRLQKLALGIEESRAYWQRWQPGVRPERLNRDAFEERWFGAKSLGRIRVVIADLKARYDAFPAAFAVLRRWPDMHPLTRRLICHWHLQLSDPLYRQFTGAWLPCRCNGMGQIDFRVVLQWVIEVNPKGWGAATCRQVAGKLLSAASEAGLVSPAPDPRRPLAPRPDDLALGYILFLLRETQFAGTLLTNPYVGSVGLSGVIFEQRLTGVNWVRLHRMGNVTQFEWRCPSLAGWAEANL
jgi:hypothetical protein